MLLLSIGVIEKRINISNILKISMMGIIDNTNFLLLFFPSLTSLDMATGNPKEHNVINRLKVGSIKEYIPIPLVEMALVKAILIIIPNIFVIIPPISKIIVDFIKLLLIIKYMIRYRFL